MRRQGNVLPTGVRDVETKQRKKAKSRKVHPELVDACGKALSESWYLPPRKKVQGVDCYAGTWPWRL